MSAHFLAFLALMSIVVPKGVTAVRIRELNVPALVEDGSENILLDCDYDYEENEKVQLEIKWYFNSEPTPFYQWVPEKNARPQIIGDKFRHHVDLDHVVHTDSHKRHRALLLKRPTTELSGVYTCKVSSLISEDTQRKRMIVYSPASSITFQQERLPTGQQVNVSCSAKNIYPQPQIKLTKGHFELDDSEALIQATSNNFSRGYDIIVHRLVDHSELPSEIEFGCVLTIPGTNYEIREKSIYKIRSGRNFGKHIIDSKRQFWEMANENSGFSHHTGYYSAAAPTSSHHVQQTSYIAMVICAMVVKFYLV